MDIFTQYEQASQRNKPIHPELSSTGFIQMKLEQETPIFSKIKMNFNPSDKITHMAVSNNYLILTMENTRLFRIDLQQPDKHDEITLSKYTSGKLKNIFLDPLGQHIMLAFASDPPELLYLSRKSTTPKLAVKFRGHDITEVGWNFANESYLTTGPILLGTSKGLIFETEILQNEDKFFQTSLEQYWKQVFDIGKGSPIPITGLEFYRMPHTDRYIIFVSTPDRLYYFHGHCSPEEKPLLQQVFNGYLNIKEKYHSVPSKLNFSKLKFWYNTQTMTPEALGWMVESEIFYTQLTTKNLENFDSLINSFEKIKYPKPIYEDLSKSQKKPMAFVLTQFHALLAYRDMIKGVSVLNSDFIFEDSYNESFGILINIVKDPMKGTVWTVTKNSVFRYKIVKEERNVWQIYCAKNQFDLAKQYSKDNPAHYDQVLVKEANVLFEKGEYDASAERYAKTQSSFEEICLKFLTIEKHDALKIYLKNKLESLTAQDKTQTTIIVLWMVELYLTQLEDMRLEGKEKTQTYFNLKGAFDSFLKLSTIKNCIEENKYRICDLMASHGDKENLIKFTIINKDFEQVIRQHIYKNNFLEALDVLKDQQQRDLFYQFAPILMQEIPKQMVNALIAQGRNLHPIKILPALVNCDSIETIRYLEYCVTFLNCNERSIHNLLLASYACAQPDKLMQYLAAQGQDITMVCYDVHFALRLCREKELIEACIQLSALLGLWESAVDLALKINVNLAKQTANLPQNDDELRRKLWLKIAQHVISNIRISGEDDIKKGMELLQQCELIRIEDILSFFSDFVTIDHFKQAICTSLQECKQHIQDLKEEMEEATESAERVRNEIQSFRNRYTYIKTTDTCSICNMTLIVRAFYLFPCGHRFHSDCLLMELTPNLGPAKRNKLIELHGLLAVLNTQPQPDNVSTSSTSLSHRDQVKLDIDNIVASECLYCGEIMIRNIDKSFIDEKEYDKVMKEWE